MLNKIINFFRIAVISDEEQYLSRSISAQDLERRLREIARGEAPYQRNRTLRNQGNGQ
jgi:hypothetical protein